LSIFLSFCSRLSLSFPPLAPPGKVLITAAVIDDERYVRVINQSPQEEKKGKQGKKEKRGRERKKKTGASAADASQ